MKAWTIAALAAATGAGAWFARRHHQVQLAHPSLRHRLNYRVLPVNNPLVLAYYQHIVHKPTPVLDGVTVEHLQIPTAAPGDDHLVDLYVYTPQAGVTSRGALLWVHGGGLIMGSAALDHTHCSQLALELGITVVSVDYRLAPHHPYPAALNDCFAALAWLADEGTKGRFDPSRLVILGASAGGGLAAATAQRAHDEGITLALQGLIYPMLESGTGHTPTPGKGEFSWTPSANRYGWRSYLGRDVTDRDGRPYAVPAEREDLSGLAPTWIGVGELDLFYDENLRYAARLRAADVPVGLVTVPGMYHAADGLRPEAPAMLEFRAAMLSALRGALSS